MNEATEQRAIGRNTEEDGRTARAERTKQAIVDAVISLLEEGDLRPTVDRIAERAGVSVRSVFQHFGDRESVLEAVGRRQAERVLELIDLVSADAPLDERIDAVAAQRAKVFEMVAPVRRAALLSEPDSEVTRLGLQAGRGAAQADLERVFEGELGAMDETGRAETLAALTAATEWGTWENLRTHQGLTPERAEAAMRRAMTALLPG